MYTIAPLSAREFIQRDIRLPRFQRAQTWRANKNFELCISLFKDYPLGVAILNAESIDGEEVFWLLDGRQRRNALTMIYEDPEMIYQWATSYIKLKKNDSGYELDKKFWGTIEKYIEEEPIKIKNNNGEENNEEENNEEENNEEENNEGENNEGENNEGENGQADNIRNGQETLAILLEIIKIYHACRNDGVNGFTVYFGFHEEDVGELPRFVTEKQDNRGRVIRQVSSKKVKSFLDEYRREFISDRERYQLENFLSFVRERLNPQNWDALKDHLQNNWDNIQVRIKMTDKLEKIFTRSKIGIITVQEINFADSRKIFNIINTKGEMLNAVQVLSAKPKWNTPIAIETFDPEQRRQLINAVEELYSQLDVERDDKIVRWDLPATLLSRIGANIILGNNEGITFDDKLTLGFKLLAGIWGKGVRKEDIDALTGTGGDWFSRYEYLISDFQTMLNTMITGYYFQYISEWKTNLRKLTSDAVALNFAVVAYRKWEKHGRPSGNTTAAKAFRKECLILWDRMIYEYIMGKWKGSGDSKINNNIEQTKNGNYPLEVSAQDWINLLNEILSNQSVGGVSIKSQSSMEPILYHFYCLKKLTIPAEAQSFEVDHIMPKEALTTAGYELKKQHSLYNLALLPKKDNCAKSNKKLNQITDGWLIRMITEYEYIPRRDFDRYSDMGNLERLLKQRFKTFEEVFKVDGIRAQRIRNPE